MTAKLPPATQLTGAQYNGWACCWCGTVLKNDAVPAGRAQGRIGAHDMSIDVYACPACASAGTPTDTRSPSRNPGETSGARPSTQRATIHDRRVT